MATEPGALPDTSLFRRREADGRRRVLVVDDDITVRRLAACILAAEGFEVLEAEHGGVALDILHRLAHERLSLDLMLFDLQMPVLDGFGLLERLAEEGLAVPSASMTGNGDRNALIRLMRLGCDEFIDKPVQPDQLAERVRRMVERADRLHAARQAKDRVRTEEATRLRQESERHKRTAREWSDSFTRLHAQVETARTAWQDLIGNPDPVDGLELAWQHRSFAALGGDFLGLRSTPQGALLLVADVAGHDLGASLHSVMVKAFFEENCRGGLAPTEFLARLDQQLRSSSSQPRMVTAVLAAFDLEAMRLELVSAGHPEVLLQRTGAGAQPIGGAGSVLGMERRPEFACAVSDLDPGDRIFAFTDGLPDALRIDGRTGRRERFGLARLAAAIGPGRALQAAVGDMFRAALDFARDRPGDDLLLAGLEVRSPRGSGAEYEPQALET